MRILSLKKWQLDTEAAFDHVGDAIAHLSGLTALELIEVDSCEGSHTTAPICNSIRKLTNLKTLALVCCPFFSDTVSALALSISLTRLVKLETLRLTDSYFTGYAALEHLARGLGELGQRFTHLDLSRNNLPEDDLDALADALGGMKSLRVLSMCVCSCCAWKFNPDQHAVKLLGSLKVLHHLQV